MSKKKLIKRCKLGDTVEKSDNTRVQMPRTDVEPIKIPDEKLKWMGWREQTYPDGETYMAPPLDNGALTPVYPEFDLLTLGRSLWTMPKWRHRLPDIGKENVVYRQGQYDMLDDAIKTGVIRSIPEEVVAAKEAAAKAASKPSRLGFTADMFVKDFSDDLMFNRVEPFYGPTPKRYPVAYVGYTNKSSSLWQPRRHKGHKHIVEPFMGDTKQAPLSEFRIFTSAPFKFGWYETPMKNSFHLPIFGFSPLLSGE